MKLEGAFTLYTTDIDNHQTICDSLEWKIEKIEQKIQILLEKSDLYESKGRDTFKLQLRIEKLRDLLLILEQRYYYVEVVKEYEDIDIELIDISDIAKYVKSNYSSNFFSYQSVKTPTEIVSQLFIGNENTSTNISDKENSIPNWVEENTKRGALGEYLAKKYLMEIENKNIISVVDIPSKGYDLEWKREDEIIGYEVKTSESYNGFHITINELQKAKFMQNNYNIFFIKIDPVTKNIEGFIIVNPVQALGIPVNELSIVIDLENGSIKPNKFYYTFYAKFINNVEKISIPSEWLDQYESN